LHNLQKSQPCDKYKGFFENCCLFFAMVGSHYWSCRHPLRKWLLWIWCVFSTRLS